MRHSPEWARSRAPGVEGGRGVLHASSFRTPDCPDDACADSCGYADGDECNPEKLRPGKLEIDSHDRSMRELRILCAHLPIWRVAGQPSSTFSTCVLAGSRSIFPCVDQSKPGHRIARGVVDQDRVWLTVIEGVALSPLPQARDHDEQIHTASGQDVLVAGPLFVRSDFENSLLDKGFQPVRQDILCRCAGFAETD